MNLSFRSAFQCNEILFAATGEPVVRVVGVDVFILDMLARNFKFTYEVSPAKTFDVYTLPNGTKIGGVHWGRSIKRL